MLFVCKRTIGNPAACVRFSLVYKMLETASAWRNRNRCWNVPPSCRAFQSHCRQVLLLANNILIPRRDLYFVRCPMLFLPNHTVSRKLKRWTSARDHSRHWTCSVTPGSLRAQDLANMRFTQSLQIMRSAPELLTS